MLGALDRKPVPRVVVSHLRDRHETALEITEAEFATLRIAADFHVHETSGTPKMNGKIESVKCSQIKCLIQRQKFCYFKFFGVHMIGAPSRHTKLNESSHQISIECTIKELIFLCKFKMCNFHTLMKGRTPASTSRLCGLSSSPLFGSARFLQLPDGKWRHGTI